METISLKIDGHMLKTIDSSLKKNNFSTRTEFIRSAIRKKLDELSRDELLKELLSYKGKFKHLNTSDKELEKIKEEAFEELKRERGL